MKNWNVSIKFNTVYWVISVGVNSVVFSKSKRKYSVVIICGDFKYLMDNAGLLMMVELHGDFSVLWAFQEC